jgi:phage shock protein PspC (stress-responsive transcriptional regulator)
MVGSAVRRDAAPMSTTPPPPENPEQPTEATQQMGGPDPTPPGGSARRFTRSRSDRVVAGVAGGLGRYFAIDPVLVRIAIVVLTFFGGAGALLYLAAILLVPNEDEAAATAASGAPPPERNRGLVILGVILLVLVAGPLLFGPALAIGALGFPLAFLALCGLLVGWLVTGRRPERDAGDLVRTTLLGLGLLALCFVLAIGAFWLAGVGGDAVVAGVVIAAGVAVLVGAFVRPVRWLVVPALAVAIPAAFVSAAGISLDGGYGERTYRPSTPAELADSYEIGAGRIVVDLRGVDLPAGRRDLALDVGMGEAVVIVPDDVCVATDARLGMGGVDVFDRDGGGVDVDFLDQETPAAGATELVLDAQIGIGHLDVRTTDPDDHFEGFRDRRFDRGDREDPLIRGGNPACA